MKLTFWPQIQHLCWIPIVFLLLVLDVTLVPKDLSWIYQWIHLFFLIDQPVCVSLLPLADIDGDGEKGSNVKPLSILQPVLHPAISLAPAAFGNECSLMQTPLLISISLSLAVRRPAEMRYTLELRASGSTPAQDDRDFQPMARMALTTPSSLPVWWS